MADYVRDMKKEQQQRFKNTRIFGAIAAILLLAALIVTKTKENNADPTLSETPSPLLLVTEAHGPESGTVFYRKYEKNPAALHISNNTTADICAKCSDGLFNSAVICFYLRAGEDITLEVPVGYFELHAAAGESWDDEESLFGEDTVYYKDTLQNGLEFGRKKTCEFTIESGFVNMERLEAKDY